MPKKGKKWNDENDELEDLFDEDEAVLQAAIAKMKNDQQIGTAIQQEEEEDLDEAPESISLEESKSQSLEKRKQEKAAEIQ